MQAAVVLVFMPATKAWTAAQILLFLSARLPLSTATSRPLYQTIDFLVHRLSSPTRS